MDGTVDSLGRIAIPKALLERLGLAAGSRVRLEAEGERLMVEPVPSGTLTWDENGMPLLDVHVPPGFEIIQALEEARKERSEDVLGWKLP